MKFYAILFPSTAKAIFIVFNYKLVRFQEKKNDRSSLKIIFISNICVAFNLS